MMGGKKIFAITFICGALIISAQTANAQMEQSTAVGRGPASSKRDMGAMSRPDNRLNLLTRSLQLTKEQQEKIKPILVEEYAQLEALRGNDKYNRDERRARLRELNESTYEKIKPILTPEQQLKHEQNKKIVMETRAKKRSTRPGTSPEENTPDKRLSRLTLYLNLTAEQQAKIKPILVEEYGQLETLRGNDAYNREQRRAKLQSLHEATYGKINAVLTPEQQKKHEEIKQRIIERRSQSKEKREMPKQ